MMAGVVAASVVESEKHPTENELQRKKSHPRKSKSLQRRRPERRQIKAMTTTSLHCCWWKARTKLSKWWKVSGTCVVREAMDEWTKRPITVDGKILSGLSTPGRRSKWR